MSEALLESLQADFDVLDDWEERYRYVIELGRALAPFDEKWRNAAYKVSGCASQVWIHPTLSTAGGKAVITFKIGRAFV